MGLVVAMGVEVVADEAIGAPWPESYKHPYYYTAKQLGTPAGMVPYVVEVNIVPLFSEYSLP